MPRWCAHLLLLIVSIALAPLAAAELAIDTRMAVDVLLVSSERGGAYEETLDVLRDRLSRLEPRPLVAVHQWKDVHPEGRARVIVTIGARAAAEVGTGWQDAVVINTLLPSHSFENLHRQRSRDELNRISAVFLDQPVRRQIRLLRAALPDWTNVAVISGPTSRDLGLAIDSEARRAGLSVRRSEIDSDRELFRALQETLEHPALLIALPDRNIYNSTTIQNILLTSYRRHSPLIGFSAAYVRAGALLGVYSHPAQVASQTADAVATVLRGDPTPPPRYPVAFEVGVNQTVARSLRIRLDAAHLIEARLRLLEAGISHD